MAVRTDQALAAPRSFSSGPPFFRHRHRRLFAWVPLVSLVAVFASVVGPIRELSAQSAELSISTRASLSTGWKVITSDWNNPAAAPTGAGITVTPANETRGAVRIQAPTPVVGYAALDVELSPNLEGRTLHLWAFDTSYRQMAGFDSVGSVSNGRVRLAMPAAPVSILYLWDLGTAPMTFLSVTLSNSAATPNPAPPPSNPAPPQQITIAQQTAPQQTATTQQPLTPAALAPGWSVQTDWRTPIPTPAGNGITLTPAADTNGSVRVVAPSQSGPSTITVDFGPGLAGRTVSLWAFGGSNNSWINGYQSDSLVSNDRATFAAPPVAYGVLQIFGLGSAPITLRAITLGSTPTPSTPTNVTPTTAPIPTSSPVASVVTLSSTDIILPAAVAPGWSLITSWQNPAVAHIPGTGFSFSPHTDTWGSVRLMSPTPQSSYASIRMEIGPGLDGTNIGMWAYDTSFTQINGYEVRGVVRGGAVQLNLPNVAYRMLYMWNLGSLPLTIRSAILSVNPTSATPIAATPVVNTRPVVSAPTVVSEEDPTVSAWPTGRTCRSVRIWMIGDSLTNGEFSLNHRNSFRYELFRLLKAEGLPVIFRGSRNFGPLPAGETEFSYSGYGGWASEHLLYGNPNERNDGSIESWAPQANADVIVLNIGTNKGTGDELATYRTLVARLGQLAPNAVIVLGTLPLTRSGNDNDGRRLALIDLVRQLGASSSTDRIITADVNASMRTGVASPMGASDYLDDVHYSEAGAAKYARALLARTSQAVRRIGCR